MIPQLNDGLNPDFQFEEPPSNTYKLNIQKDIIAGYTDGADAMAQAIYLVLNIERYDFLIYSWNYGVELADLIGQPLAYTLPEIKRRISEALLQDSRIKAVDNFKFEQTKTSVHAIFTVHTVFGEIDAEKVVTI